MPKFIVKDGYLYEIDNKISKKVRPEFGNPDHIKAVRKYEKQLYDFKYGKDVEPICTITAQVLFECMCGGIVETGEYEISELDDYETFDSDKIKCRSCNQEYILKVPRNSGTVSAFLHPPLREGTPPGRSYSPILYKNEKIQFPA
jgi:hypothetical protein